MRTPYRIALIGLALLTGTPFCSAASNEQVLTVAQKLPATIDWLSPAPGALLDVGTRYVLRVQTGSEEGPVTYSLMSGAATLEGDELLPSAAGVIQLRVRQAENDKYLPLDATAQFNVVQRKQSTVKWLNPLPGTVLKVGDGA